MGNQASTPAPPINSPVTPMQIPVCDMECQRQKELSNLLSAYQTAENTKSSDPERYEQARIKYFTLKDGQGWLATEKERLAKIEVEPILRELDSKYEMLQSNLKQKKEQQDLINLMKSHEVGDEDESRYIKHQLMKEKDKIGVVHRLTQIGNPLLPMNSWLSTALDVTIACLVLFIIYSVFKRTRSVSA
jgi:hypothetical protein